MAILKSIVDVNNGNTGWTKSDVLDSLETVFANLGWNNGTAATGVPCVVKAPDGAFASETGYQWTQGYNTRVAGFEHCGGVYPPSTAYKVRYFNLSNNTTASYRVLEEWRINGSSASTINSSNNTVTEPRHGLITGDAVSYAAGITSGDNAKTISGLAVDTVYYVIRTDDNVFKLATTSTNATNGVAISISPATSTGYYFQRASDAAYDNYTIRVKRGDEIKLNSSGASGGGGALYLLRNSDSYDATKLLTKVATSYAADPTGQGTTDIVWDTQAYRQTEDEALNPLRAIGAGPGTSLDDEGIVKYTYANDTNSSMKGEIVIEPFISTRGSGPFNPYWDYTVPASGSRSELKLRVYRGNQWYHSPFIVNIEVRSIGSGWSNEDVFTIPGEEIGGVATTNDVVFGVNTDESSSNAYDGKPSILVTSFGAGSNFYQKNSSGNYGLAKVTHDAGKTYGTTFYGIGLDQNSSYRLVITSGSNFDWLNRACINTDAKTETVHNGVYSGEAGLDYQSSYKTIRKTYTGNFNGSMEYASNSTPTAYPLQIRVYRAQSPQDPNFAVIQFCQIINSIVQPFGTFSLAKGSSFGSGVYDLDYVFQDSILKIEDGGARSIRFKYADTGYSYYSQSTVEEPASTNTKARAASYGYLRNSNISAYAGKQSLFSSNIDTQNDTGSSHTITYYRNSTYDAYDGKSVSSSANYYKPIKGIPVCMGLLPVPYYLPDDFVMLQVGTTPGLTAFRTGDTVTVSGSEIYEIIWAEYESQQNGLDNVNNNSTIGMLFMARTT